MPFCRKFPTIEKQGEKREHHRNETLHEVGDTIPGRTKQISYEVKGNMFSTHSGKCTCCMHKKEQL